MKEDSLQIADLHVRSFPGFFLTSFGKAFLAVFYSSVLREKEGYGVGIFKGDNLVGFAVGSTLSKGFYKKLVKKYGTKLLLKALPRLSLKRVSHISKNLLGAGGTLALPSRSGMLLSICIDQHCQNQGLGKKLLHHYEECSKAHNLTGIGLTTDKTENQHANKFYEKSGYTILESYEIYNRKMNLYFKKL